MTRRLVALIAAATITASACVGGEAEPEPGSTVELFGPFRAEEADLLAASLADFEEASGISVRYTGTGSFVADLEAQIAADDPPDIALVPQPGLVAELVRTGEAIPLSDETTAAVDEHYDEVTRELGVVDGILAAVPFQVSVKSLVWYRPAVFRQHGYAAPTSLDELDALVARIEADGLTPWCLGIEAQGATGWVATDWVEELVLRLAGPEVYDEWVEGTVGFGEQRIAQAFRRFRELALAPGRVDGGISGVLRTPVRDSVGGLFQGSPDCVLHRQASFVYGVMPSGTVFGPDGDVDFFVLPGADPGGPPPILVGSTVAVALTRSDAVDRVMTQLATPGSTRVWSEAGGFTTPRRPSPLDGVSPAVDQAVRDALLDSTVVRADASDAMPPAIGTSLYWEQITEWITERVSYDQLATTLDQARAELSGPAA